MIDDGRRRSAQALLLLLSMACWTTAYVVVQRRPTREPLLTRLALDDAVPTVREAVWLYMSPYLVAILVAASLSAGTFRAILLRAWLLVAAAHAAFLAVPTRVDRPAFEPGPGLTERFHALVVAFDTPPGNAAPSLHVGLSVLLAWAVARDHPRPAGRLAWSFAVAVGLSTLLTRQHHLIDVATGAALAFLVLLCCRMLERRGR